MEFLINSADFCITSFINSSPILFLCDVFSFPLCLHLLFYYCFLPLAFGVFYSPFPVFPSFLLFSVTELEGNFEEVMFSSDLLKVGT